jgi:HPt (histidine-containing phosphotransfer) domain-containing protein
MTVKECYTKLEGDYEGVLSRLMKDALVSRFLLMFLDDKEHTAFHEALDAGDYPTAFRAVHTLKGACLNLGFTKLAGFADVLTETLRNGAPSEDISGMIGDLDAQYALTQSVIKEFKENPEV